MQKRQVRRPKRRGAQSSVKGLRERQARKRHSDALEAFTRVYDLLEEYGPAWYSAALRRKLRAALKSLSR